jgi:ubiquinone biosynthesis protein
MATVHLRERQVTPDSLQSLFGTVLAQYTGVAERVKAIEFALTGPAGDYAREQLGNLLVERWIPVEVLVPRSYRRWEAPVRDAMLYVVSKLSPARLTPKILEQITIANSPPEQRLLQIIAKVPGLQKLGQVIARNRHLRPSLRKALVELENGIRDVTADDICAVIRQELGARVKTYNVEIEPAILSEASVSAVVRFTFCHPGSRQRERGVFKVLKPHIPEYFKEDMDILQGLAEFFVEKPHTYGVASRILTDTFTKVRRLLEHEVDFIREQNILLRACAAYREIPGVRVPRLIPQLCTSRVTAMTEEQGVKVTDAVAQLSALERERLSALLIETLLAVPLFADRASALFHADPHAGNLLYDVPSQELIVLDWALTERLSRAQRRHLALLVLLVGLRDPVGVSGEILALSEHGLRSRTQQLPKIRQVVTRFFDELPLTHFPGAVEAMRLLESVAFSGIRFPAPLIMFSKAMFTLDDILREISDGDVSMGRTLGLVLVRRWLTGAVDFGSPLDVNDWLRVQSSAMLFGPRLMVRSEQELLGRTFDFIRSSPTLAH